MGTEAIAMILGVTAAAILALLLGRMLSLILKIAIVAALAYFAFTHLDLKETSWCRPGGALSARAASLCR